MTFKVNVKDKISNYTNVSKNVCNSDLNCMKMKKVSSDNL